MLIRFKPIGLEKVWGGNILSKLYNMDSSSIGEIWGISAHKSHSNLITYGMYQGMAFRELYTSHRELFGNLKNDEFPLLFKIIQAAGDLSIQVHPDDAYAESNEKSLGKEECWYILKTFNKSTNIIIGHSAANKQEFLDALNNNQIENIVNRLRINTGNYFYIPAGTIHAICKDTMLLEVSQSSDITYRLYDYNRLDTGKLRELHLKKAKEVVTIPDNSVITKHDSKIFDFRVVNNTKISALIAHKYGDYIYVIDGQGLCNDEEIKTGEFLMISSEDSYVLEGILKYALINVS